ncbi:MAG TPA: DUF3473 domain-containing protein [Gammaproteobacteria bacterium]|nr:DUF3473 domain-containing protein [Gammaproteobacteria bacterium]
MDNTVINAMSVDVEDYFQVSALEPYIPRSAWDRQPCRVEANTSAVLELFAAAGVQATFFTLGWVAERFPHLIRRIVDEGHELASHGRDHTRVTAMTPGQFRADVRRTKALLEDLSGQEVKGYRAPSYSIGANNLWALEVLQEEGHRYSSSIYPIRHDLYGMPEAPRFAFRPHGEHGILEVPVTTTTFFNHNVPCGGGGYFRLLPYTWSRWALRHINRREGQPGMFYFHPWEIDPGQPRMQGIGLKTRVRHYLNLGRMQARLQRLLRDFRWGRMDQVFLKPQADKGA